MRFYYISLFSLILLGLIYVFGTVFLVWLRKLLKKRWNGAWKVMVPLFLLLYIGPIAEELWIAWNFGQLCKKEAGIFINKTVEVDGFYDDTGGTIGIVRDGGYKWAEGPGRNGNGAYRLTKGDDALTLKAIARFESDNPGSTASERPSITVQMSPDVEVLVFPQKHESWRMQILDQPNARYHYVRVADHLEVALGIKKFERAVVDTLTSEILGNSVDFSRQAPWFFIHLDKPVMFCRETENAAHKIGKPFSYRLVLTPQQSGT